MLLRHYSILAVVFHVLEYRLNMILLDELFSIVVSVAGRLSLASKGHVYDSPLRLCYAVYLCGKDFGLLPLLTSLAMNMRHNNPIVSQRICLLAGYVRH